MIDTSLRMQNAMEQAHRCWARAVNVSPAFVEKYLALCEQLLLSRPEVPGDEFRGYCQRNGLVRPAALHPNVWVSGPRALTSLGWVEKKARVEPTQMHNHMHVVTLWRSLIFGGR